MPGYIDSRRVDRAAVLLSSWSPPPQQRCYVSQRPAVLPPIDSLITTSDIPILLEQGGLDSPRGFALLSLKFDTLGAAARVRVIETDMSGTASDVIEQAVLSAVRHQAPGEAVGLRVRIDFGPPIRYAVGRSEKCDAVLVEPYIPNGNTGAAPVGAALDRQVDKKKITMHWSVLVGADGIVADAIPGQAYVQSDLAEEMTRRIRAERYYAARDDGVPVQSVVDVKRSLTIVMVVLSH